ncbi:MAG TPA: translocation/assembly module TamB domain-containing protein [Steroidobacteraceae bacterium]|nr:translocation/assembly module TamB domain-containing protein [Steroidobacteraceae bacterium]
MHADAQGQVDLVHQSADLNFAIDAPAMAPRADLSWQRIALEGRWLGSIKSPRADARLAIERLRLPGGAEVGALKGDLHAAGGALGVRATLEELVVPGPQPRLLASSPLRLEANARLDAPGRPVAVSAEHRLLALDARATTTAEPSVTFNLRLPDVNPFAALAGLHLRGRSTLNGSLAEHAGALRASLTADNDLAEDAALPAALLAGRSRVQLTGAVSEHAFELDHLSLAAPRVTFAGSGSARRGSIPSAPALESLRGRYEVRLPDLRVLAQTVGGPASVTGAFEGPADSFALQAHFTAAPAVRGARPESVEGDLKARGLPALAGATLSAHGTLLGAALALDTSVQRAAGDAYHLIVKQAGWKSMRIEGDLTSDVHLSAGKGSLRLRMDRLEDLQPLLGTSLHGSVAGTVALRPAARGTLAEVRMDAQRVGAAGLAAEAHLRASGAIDALGVQLAVKSPDVGGAAAAIQTASRLNLSARELQLQQAEAHYRGQTLRLLAPAQLNFASGVSVQGFKLGVQHALIELDGRLSPVLDARASVRHVDAQLLSAFIPDVLTQGSFDADAQLKGAVSAPTGEVHAKLSGVRFANAAARDLQALGVQASAHLAAGAVQLETHLTAGADSQLTLTGGAPLSGEGMLDLKLAGKLDAALVNPLLEARGERAAGTLTVNARVTGAVRTPQIVGTVDVAHGDVRDYNQGVHVSQITAHLVGSEGTLRIASLSGHAGPGQIDVTGTIGVLQPKMPLEVHLLAKNAQPVASDILTANVDADLTVKGNLSEHVDLGGTLNLNRTVIGIPNALPPDVAVLDVRRPGQAPPAPQERKLVIGLDVKLQAPREVLVQGRGLNAELGGELRLRGTAQDPRVSGGFDLIRGTFALASTQLNFTNGRVSFNGTGLKHRIDPTIDFRAQTSTSDSTVTLHITGFADAPQFALESSPQLPQDEILARLLFGVSASQLSALQLAQIGAAFASLSGVGGGGPNPLVRVQKALGLDRLSVGSGGPPSATGESSGTTVEAGRYVSERVFVGLRHSTVGFSQVEADVDLSKHLKLQTRLGNGTATAQGTTPENDPGSSVGLVYQFEY